METFLAVLSIIAALSSLILYIVLIGNYDDDKVKKRKRDSKYINDSKQNNND